jgi:hypothetical protein
MSLNTGSTGGRDYLEMRLVVLWPLRATCDNPRNMLDTFYPALVSVVTIALGLAPGLWPEQFKRWPYRIAAGICAILLGLGTYAVMEHERRTAESKAVKDREAAIQETSVRVAASTSASVADVLGRPFAETVAEVRGMRKETVASTAEVHALVAETRTGKQKRQTVIDEINNRIKRTGLIFDICRSAGPPGSGGSHPEHAIASAPIGRQKFEAIS